LLVAAVVGAVVVAVPPHPIPILILLLPSILAVAVGQCHLVVIHRMVPVVSQSRCLLTNFPVSNGLQW
jgi:hypothetical protein